VLVVVLGLGFWFEAWHRDKTVNAGRQPGAQRVPGIHICSRVWTCQEAEDENDVEDENDWGSRGEELRPTIAGIVCLKAIDQSGQHCYKTREHFLTGSLLASFPPKSSSCSSSSSSSAFGLRRGTETRP
jgi:hypothetical protein